MKKMIKIILAAVAIIGIVSIGIYSALKPLAVEAVKLELSEGEISFTETGHLVDGDETNIYPETGGRIITVNAAKGDAVKKGALLAVLDSSDIDFQIKQTQSTLAAYEAQKAQVGVENRNAIDTMNANKNNLYSQIEALKVQQTMGSSGSADQIKMQELIVAQSKETWERSLEVLDKNTQLFNEGIISKSELEQMQDIATGNQRSYDQSIIQLKNLNTTVANSDYYDATIGALKAQIEGINTSLSRDNVSAMTAYYDAMLQSTQAALEGLQSQKNKYNILAPQDGIVSDVYIDKTNVAGMMEPAFKLYSGEDIRVEIYVNTRDIAEVQLDETVTLIVDQRSGDQEIAGKIIAIDEEATEKISPLGVEERKVLVTIEPQENAILKKGYNVDVKFNVFSAVDKIIVPNSALFKKDDKDMVLIIADGKIAEAEVALGYELVGETIVETGLAQGDFLITDLDLEGLKIGKKVVVAQ